MRYDGFVCAALLASACAQPGGAAPPRAAPAPAPAVVATPTAVVTQPPEPDLGDPVGQFLVHAESGPIELRSRASDAKQILAPHADAVLYQAALELVWFRDEDRLGVIDLREPNAPPIVIARGMPSANHIAIEHGATSVETEDGCDVPGVALEWSATPSIEGENADAPELRIDDGGWLRAQVARTARKTGDRRDEFDSPRVRLPAKLLDCEEKEACGQTLAFGARGLQLVRVLERMGGDCWQRACLLRDPSTDTFASPSHLDTWGAPNATSRGTCGPFLFDQAQTSFLRARQLCGPDGACNDLGGRGVGWRVPGDSVGVAGTFAE